jgi:putative DNA primase/helicase
MTRVPRLRGDGHHYLGAGASAGCVTMSTDRASADAIEIARLAALPPIECDRQLREAAKGLGCYVSTLRRQVEDARCDDTEHVTRQGRALDLHEPEQWPQPVDGAGLLDELAAAVRRHIVLGEAEAFAVALWVVGVHAFDAWTIFPRLFISSPEKGCGKSTLLDVLSCLVPKPLVASSITPAALFRVIEAARPTLLLDEADSYARDN